MTTMTGTDITTTDCMTTDPDLWTSDDWMEVQQAKAMCRRCPIREACLADALRSPEIREFGGIYGGVDFTHRPKNFDHCPRGHVRTEANTSRSDKGYLSCSDCSVR